MNIPLEIVFHGMDPSEAVEARIREKAAKLDRRHNHLTSCRVVVDRPHQHHRSHKGWRVAVEMMVPPGHEITVSKDSGDAQGEVHDNLIRVVDEVFQASQRRLEKLQQRQRGEVKVHESSPQSLGKVERLNKDHGFLVDESGDTLYFHAHAVQLPLQFADLTVGSRVSFASEQGKEGPQACWVRPA